MKKRCNKIFLLLIAFIIISSRLPKIIAITQGDTNGDGKVDGTDYVTWLNHYGQQTSGGASNGDFDGNSIVDGIDYILWLNNYGTPSPSITPTLPISNGPTLYVSPSGNDNNSGSASSPFRSIQKAANTATAGTTVFIQPGTYSGFHIGNSGTSTKPITFQSTKRWGAIIDGGNNACTLVQGGEYITLRGLVIQNASWSAYCGAVMPQRGWTIEDSLIQNTGDGMDIKGDLFNVDNVTILRTVFQDNIGNSVWGAGNGDGRGSYLMQNLTFKDVIFRRSNQGGNDPGYAYGAMKILTSNNTIGTYITSYDNVGSGYWLDWQNDNFIIENSSAFGNHGVNYDWEAPGFWSEVNSKGVIRNNLSYNNTGAGIGLLENNTVTIQNNILIDNRSTGIEVRSIPNRLYQTGNINISYNKFKQGISDGVGGWFGDNQPNATKPGDVTVSMDFDTFDPSTSTWLSWNYKSCGSATTCNSTFGYNLEKNATVNTVSLPVGFKSYPTYTTKNSSQFIQLPKTNETNGIDKAVGNSSVGTNVSIPVYRRGPFSGNGPWKVEVFDLSMRRMTLTISDATKKSNFENTVSIYAKLDPTVFPINITSLDEYNWQATY